MVPLKSRKTRNRKIQEGLNTTLHMVSVNDKVIVRMHLPAGNGYDIPEGRISIESVCSKYERFPLLMDMAYEADDTHELATKYDHKPIVPSKKNSKNPWDYDKEKYKWRNTV